MTTPKDCPRCSSLLTVEADAFGDRLFCRNGCWQLDLLAPPPKDLALVIEIGNLDDGVGGGSGGSMHDRRSGSGDHTTQIKREPHAGGYRPLR
jgi:hypothetical protein